MIDNKGCKNQNCSYEAFQIGTIKEAKTLKLIPVANFSKGTEDLEAVFRTAISNPIITARINSAARSMTPISSVSFEVYIHGDKWSEASFSKPKNDIYSIFKVV